MSKYISITILASLLATVCWPAVAVQAQDRKEPLAVQVKNSIDSGIKFMRENQQRDGSWQVDVIPIDVRGGGTALAVLALLNCGVPVNDPAVSAGLKSLRGVKSENTYVRSLQTMAYAEALKSGNKEDLLRIQENVDWLLAGRIFDANGALLGWGYPREPRPGPDNSNSQYALLGLWAGKISGANIDAKVWQQIRAFYVNSQNADGSWNYMNRGGTGSLTMTTAGLCGLIIAGMESSTGREILRDDGTAKDCGLYEENEAISKGLAWIGNPQHFRSNLPSATFYNLYGIERAGRMSGERFFGNYDWYREGCLFLVKQQSEDGSWRSPSPYDRSPVINSSFALLFLSKGRTPILMSKVVHTDSWPRDRGDTDWNNDRNDLRHLTQFASEHLFKNVPLAWQTFDMLRATSGQLEGKVKFDAEADPEPLMREIVSEMLQSPIMYINGHRSPEHRFRSIELELLRRYVDNGGFIFVEACCGKPEFDAGFKALAKKLWPNSDLVELGSGHAVWNSKFIVTPGDPYKLMGIEMGCKTVLIYSPQDMSCQWEANKPKTARGDRAFKLGANIIAYATGLEPPQPRLTHVELPGGRDKSNIPRGYFKVGQLKYRDRDWQPAPQAMHNLMYHLNKDAGLDVALKTEELTFDSKALIDYKFIYMHGRTDFEVDPAQLANLRFDLENGGLLFADACCGKPAFDKSFRKFVTALLPGKKLEAIPLDDVLFSKELNRVKLDERIIRCRLKPARTREAAAQEGEANEAGLMQNVPPMLEGIKIDNRWVVIYSRYDIGCALERHRSSDCLGYDTDSAFKLASAAVLYLLRLQ